ncbi:unnamed protein product [Lepeophtheirus salmonis]|uniref:(salmon louse) hypothetical protein n=1 Tax=Lepeophtheirus salmonis TaxID=72036 RepID=A0A7R8CEP5_LEPSM|nr:unnamed protein product [Lepeophtheirus salmonis]CAF2797568.1 unnamed protein product [Lepeophtheirus salmonis]
MLEKATATSSLPSNVLFEARKGSYCAVSTSVKISVPVTLLVHILFHNATDFICYLLDLCLPSPFTQNYELQKDYFIPLCRGVGYVFRNTWVGFVVLRSPGGPPTGGSDEAKGCESGRIELVLVVDEWIYNCFS